MSYEDQSHALHHQSTVLCPLDQNVGQLKYNRSCDTYHTYTSHFNIVMDRESAKKSMTPAPVQQNPMSEQDSRKRRRTQYTKHKTSRKRARYDMTPQAKSLGKDFCVKPVKRKAQEDTEEPTERQRKRSRTDGNNRSESKKQDAQIRKCETKCPEDGEGPISTNKKMNTDIVIVRNNFNTMMDREPAKRNTIPALAHVAMAMPAKCGRPPWGEDFHVRPGKRKAQEDAVEQTEKQKKKKSRIDGDKRPESIKQDVQISKCKRKCPEDRERPASTNKKMKLDTEKESAYTLATAEKGKLII